MDELEYIEYIAELDEIRGNPLVLGMVASILYSIKHRVVNFMAGLSNFFHRQPKRFRKINPDNWDWIPTKRPGQATSLRIDQVLQRQKRRRKGTRTGLRISQRVYN